jgi:hypothetical protein
VTTETARCECGAIVMASSLAAHTKLKKHKNAIQKKNAGMATERGPLEARQGRGPGAGEAQT